MNQCGERKEGRMLHEPGELSYFASRSVPFVGDCQLSCYDLNSD